ncbi:hypothetical protein ASJ33_05470 [Dehalococcoides mccartyi]|uniref:hypothetical protein n=1 Tax=Dehalococcoides mccartyi TaxID=61435 RepID=UPI00090AE96B|nr:hypothetical protein [Dehalococcoides mccartyi]APH12638.1 hypothetical protein ASJ33_05470 [Dehalococcoides mccartyi]
MKRTELKRRTPMKRISKKMQRQRAKEVVLKKQILKEQGRCGMDDSRAACLICGKWALLHKHEIKSRGQCGDALDRKNCVCICGSCHEDCTNGIIKLVVDEDDLVVTWVKTSKTKRILNYMKPLEVTA